MAYESVKNQIDAYIKANGVNLITGPVLNAVLTTMLDELGEGYAFQGALDTTDTPSPAADIPQAWLASAGTYLGGSITVDEGELALIIHTADGWSKETVYRGVQLSYEAIVAALGYTPADDADLAEKQDAIADLSTIRSGAALGSTSVQPADIENMVEAEPIGSIIPPVNPSEFATKEELSQLSQKADVLIGSASFPSPNLFDKTDVSAANTGISKNVGVEFTYPGGIGTGFIEIPDGATSIYPSKSRFGGSAGWAKYDSGKSFTSGGNTLPIPVSSGDKYVRITLPSDDYLTAMVVVGTASNVPSEYVPYGTITTYYLKNGVVKTDNIEDGAITSDKIADGAITEDLLDIFVDVTGKNKLNLNDPDYLTGKYIGTDKAEHSNEGLDTSGYIPFTQDMGHLVIGYNGGLITNKPNYAGIALYNAQKQIIASISYADNNGIATWESGVAFARFLIRHINEDTAKYQVEIGQIPTPFVPYQEAKELADTSIDVSPNIPVKSLDGNMLKDGTISSEKLAHGITFPSVRPALSSIGTEGYAETIFLPAGTTHTFDNCPRYVKRNFNISSSGRITAFGEFEIGVGGESINSLFVRIDGTNVYLYRYNGSSYQLLETQAHGLTISSFLNVNAFCEDGIVTVRIMSAGGGTKLVFAEVTDFDVYGLPFVKASSGTIFVSLDVRISSASMSRPVWVIGDSYVSWYNVRWPKQLANLFGIKNFHLQGKAGGVSAEMYADLVKALTFGVPRFLVWCLGMNDTYSAWESTYEDLATLCNNNGITLILQTIPWPENGTKAEINNAVRGRGLRYFDGYQAVSSDANGTWYQGMCEDGVHPTELGAEAIASRFVADFPEILSID